jgi:hypothetical protein
MSKQITNSRFDMTGNTVMRVTKHSFVSKLAPYEDFAGGPGWKCLLAALLMHYFGGVISHLMLHHDQKIRVTASRLVNRFTRR